MDRFEKVGYSALGLIAGIYILAVIIGLVAAFPFGLLGLIALVGVGSLVIKVIRERLNNKEDDYYSNKVDK